MSRLNPNSAGLLDVLEYRGGLIYKDQKLYFLNMVSLYLLEPLNNSGSLCLSVWSTIIPPLFSLVQSATSFLRLETIYFDVRERLGRIMADVASCLQMNVRLLSDDDQFLMTPCLHMDTKARIFKLGYALCKFLKNFIRYLKQQN